MKGKIEALPDRLLLQGGTLYDPTKRKSRPADLAVVNGKIAPPETVSAENTLVLDITGCIITHGFIDIHVHFREPGREDKETLETGSRAAMAGGFTHVCVMPNTDPPLDSPEAVRAILEKAERLPVHIDVIGAVSRGQRGEELTELLAMLEAGAVAFSDDGLPIQDGQLMRRALYYLKDSGVPLINHAEDIHLRDNGVINEGLLSTRMGLPGNPALAEASMVYRDLLLAEDTGGRLHVPHISTAMAVEQVRRFKDMGTHVTAEASPHHLGLTDAAVEGFETQAKVAPPLRSEMDREAIVAGLKDGTIDAIATDHAPHTVEEKEQDMLHAPFGMIGLESAVGMAHTVLSGDGMTTEKIIDLLTLGPARVMGFDLAPIENGAPVNLTILNPDESWTFSREDIFSRSRNTPMLGMSFSGKIVATLTPQNWYHAGK